MTAEVEAVTEETLPAVTVSAGRVNGRFAPGNKLGPGRPKRGESVPEKLKAKLERHGDKVVEAAFRRLLRDDSVGNRALEDALNRSYGVNAQKYVIESGSDSAAMTALLALVGSVDAEYTVLDK